MIKILVGRDYPIDLMEKIKEAKNSVIIIMYDWRWYSHQPACLVQQLNNSIIQAKKRGIEVKAILNHAHIIPILKQNGIQVIFKHTKNTMHAKIVIIDEKFAFIGSHNFSINAFELNMEVSVLTDDKALIMRCHNIYNNLCLL